MGGLQVTCFGLKRSTGDLLVMPNLFTQKSGIYYGCILELKVFQYFINSLHLLCYGCILQVEAVFNASLIPCTITAATRAVLPTSTISAVFSHIQTMVRLSGFGIF